MSPMETQSYPTYFSRLWDTVASIIREVVDSTDTVLSQSSQVVARSDATTDCSELPEFVGKNNEGIEGDNISEYLARQTLAEGDFLPLNISTSSPDVLGRKFKEISGLVDGFQLNVHNEQISSGTFDETLDSVRQTLLGYHDYLILSVNDSECGLVFQRAIPGSQQVVEAWSGDIDGDGLSDLLLLLEYSGALVLYQQR